jgi:predicted metal-dependent phosphoesterase TrpH
MPEQAKAFLTFPVEVPEGFEHLTLRLSFQPEGQWDAAGAFIRNLLTLMLFDPHRFRGAGHRHAPEQQVVVGPEEATPGFVPGPLPAGRWLVELDCHAVLPSDGGGVEYWLTVEGSGSAPPVASPERNGGAGLGEEVPEAAPVESADPGGRPDEPLKVTPAQGWSGEGEAPSRWLKGDLHIHSNHSDGRWTADDIVTFVRDNKLDFIAVTDHNTISARDDVREALRAAGLQTVVIPAMELTTFFGHANALGVTSWIDWRVEGPDRVPLHIGNGPEADRARTMVEAAAEVHHLGGTFVVNHPRSAGYPACTGCRWEYGDETMTYADVIEVMNGRWARPQNEQAMAVWDRWLNAGHQIAAAAGTDSHGFARSPQQLGYTYVMAQPDPMAILAAVRAGRSYLSRGPSVVWQEPQPGESVAPDQRRLVVQVGSLHRPVDLRLVSGGEMVYRQRLTSDGSVTLDLSEDWRRARWYRIELYERGRRNLVALTNPVFREL